MVALVVVLAFSLVNMIVGVHAVVKAHMIVIVISSMVVDLHPVAASASFDFGFEVDRVGNYCSTGQADLEWVSKAVRIFPVYI